MSRRGANAIEDADGLLRDLCFVGGYEEALRKARDEFRVLMVVLTCEENELDAEFKRYRLNHAFHLEILVFKSKNLICPKCINCNRDILHDAELLKSLKDEKVMLWGGDVMERDAYQGSSSFFSLSLSP